ncbi:MAG TPA: response regulator [Polyangiaceae bacterium]|nr:response regulator [Polyangiaceae bacterium]
MSLNVLVVDDSPVMRKMVIRVLGMSGLPIAGVHEACQGREALELLAREQGINLGLFDVNMPVLNGEELVVQIRAQPQTAALPVVMVSTEGSAERIERLKRLGAAFIRKPFGPEALLDAIISATGG